MNPYKTILIPPSSAAMGRRKPLTGLRFAGQPRLALGSACAAAAGGALRGERCAFGALEEMATGEGDHGSLVVD